jgi:hypothetical protein
VYPWIYICLAMLLAPQLLLAEASLDPRHSGYRGMWDRDKVFVIVESYDGWGRSVRSGLASDGRLTLVGAYYDTTAVRRFVAPDSALAFINDLLAIDFLGQPDAYRPFRGYASPTDDGRIGITMSYTMDAGKTRISLHLGPESHSVTLYWPAYGAPEALLDWEGRFRELVQDRVAWFRY